MDMPENTGVCSGESGVIFLDRSAIFALMLEMNEATQLN